MKHGILLLVHNNTEIVKTAMRMLDNVNFIFYVLIDKKSKLSSKDFELPLAYSTVKFLPRITVNWAAFSQIEAELLLIKAALNDNVDYLHYLQGSDLPLKTPEYIDEFFACNNGKNFIDFDPRPDKFSNYKVLCNHFFVDMPIYRNCKLLHYANHFIARIQKRYIDMKADYYQGSALFSISSDFARYLISIEKKIKKEYKHSIGADEVFICTEFMRSEFKDTLFEKRREIVQLISNGRMIDWRRSHNSSPHTFTLEDREMIDMGIADKTCIFARKFSENKDMQIVKYIESSLSNCGKNDPEA